jgi:hypothetical protein
MLIRKLFIAIFCFCQIIYVSQSFGQSPITASELIDRTPLKQYLKSLENGEIVIIGRPDSEIDTELDVFMSVLVPAPITKTVDVLQRLSTSKDTPGILYIQEITGNDSASELAGIFNKVTFGSSESGEVDQLMSIGPGDNYNLSRKEIALFKQASKTVKTGTTGNSEMSKVMGEVLKNRYLSYRKKGLKGVTAYQISASEQTSPAKELITATETIVILREKFPTYYHCLRFYPDQNISNFVHQFFLVKQREEGRPMFALKHWVLDIQSDYALITERHYFMTHSLNSLQVVIGCLPYKNGTLVALLNQAFTEKVNITIGKRVAKKVGRTIVERKIRPMFENLRAVFKK